MQTPHSVDFLFLFFGNGYARIFPLKLYQTPDWAKESDHPGPRHMGFSANSQKPKDEDANIAFASLCDFASLT